MSRLLDVGELVGDHAAQLVLGEQLRDPAGHRDRGVLRAAAGRERVRLVLRDHVEARHRQAGAGGQLADHLVEPRRLLLGERLRAGASSSAILSLNQKATKFISSAITRNTDADLDPADRVADHDQQAAERGQQDRRPQARREFGLAGGCHLRGRLLDACPTLKTQAAGLEPVPGHSDDAGPRTHRGWPLCRPGGRPWLRCPAPGTPHWRPILRWHAPREPPHPGPGREPAADRRRGGRGGVRRQSRRSTWASSPEAGARPRARGRPDDPRQRAAAPAPLPPARAAGRRDGARRPVAPGRQPARDRSTAAATRRRSPGCSRAFARMLERLEAERRRASSAALAAQEEERARVARDLHDEVNQSLTGLLLRLEAAREKAPPELAARARGDQGARQPGDGGAARPWRASCAPRRSTTSASRRRSPATSSELGRQGEVEASFEADGDFAALPAGRPAGRLPGRPGGALERRRATRAPTTSRSPARARATGSS